MLFYAINQPQIQFKIKTTRNQRVIRVLTIVVCNCGKGFLLKYG